MQERAVLLGVVGTLLDMPAGGDPRTGAYRFYPGALEMLGALPAGRWALVTGEDADEVRIRFGRLGLPVPEVVAGGHAEAAQQLGVAPERCLAITHDAASIDDAHAAGMTAWAVNVERAASRDVGADRSFRRLDLAGVHIHAWLADRRGR